MLVVLFVVVGFNWPSAHAQSISINVDYPRQTVATDIGSTRIVVTVSYSGLQSGWHILVTLYDTQRLNSGTYSAVGTAVNGTAEASPYSCTTKAESLQGKAVCFVYPTQSSGSVQIVFEATERRFGTWSVAVAADMYKPNPDPNVNDENMASTSSDISLFMVYIPFPILVGAVAVVIVVVYISRRRGRKRGLVNDVGFVPAPYSGQATTGAPPVVTAGRFCMNCGASVRPHATYCNKCGAKQ